MSFRAKLGIDKLNGTVWLGEILGELPPDGTAVRVSELGPFPRLLHLPVTEAEWHALPEESFRAAWESMPRVALLRGDEVIDADDLSECLGSIQEIANGFLTRCADGTERAVTRRYFPTRDGAVEHLRKVLAADCYRLLTEAP